MVGYTQVGLVGSLKVTTMTLQKRVDSLDNDYTP